MFHFYCCCAFLHSIRNEPKIEFPKRDKLYLLKRRRKMMEIVLLLIYNCRIDVTKCFVRTEAVQFFIFLIRFKIVSHIVCATIDLKISE